MKRLVFSMLTAASAGAVVIGMVVAAWFPLSTEVASSARVPEVAAIVPPPVPSVPGEFMNGYRAMYISGEHVRPGLWTTQGAEYCKWSRNAGSSWETAGSPTTQIVVSLRPGARFVTEMCPPWEWVGESK